MIEIFSHDTGSLLLIFCNVASPSNLSFRILYVEYPAAFNNDITSVLYPIGKLLPPSFKIKLIIKHIYTNVKCITIYTLILCVFSKKLY